MQMPASDTRLHSQMGACSLNCAYTCPPPCVPCLAPGVMESYVQEMDRKFTDVLIDEAAQATEAAVLIPLQYGCKRCVLVGDPKQLPATVISRRLQDIGYGKSLFARLSDAGYPYHMLQTQVRMRTLSIRPTRIHSFMT